LYYSLLIFNCQSLGEINAVNISWVGTYWWNQWKYWFLLQCNDMFSVQSIDTYRFVVYTYCNSIKSYIKHFPTKNQDCVKVEWWAFVILKQIFSTGSTPRRVLQPRGRLVVAGGADAHAPHRLLPVRSFGQPHYDENRPLRTHRGLVERCSSADFKSSSCFSLKYWKSFFILHLAAQDGCKLALEELFTF